MFRRFCPLVAIYLAGLAATAGCGRDRGYYRIQADQDAYGLTAQKATSLGVVPATMQIEIDPRSRMFDPHSPDCVPMPPDDPLAHQLMECVDCKKGSKCWRCLPQTPFVDNPAWQAHLPRNARGEVALDLRGAVTLALIHSPDYQSELEELYLSALDVSFERFRFDAQFFGGSSVFLTADGRDHATAPNAPSRGQFSSSVLDVGVSRPANRFRVERLTATGGELVVGMANTLMWQFAGDNDYSSNTILDFSLVQPLLRAGGRTRVLERLTIAERSLLGNVRAMERYRRGFYINIVTGRDAGGGPSRRGGFFGGSGLEGFSGVGGGGFGNVGNFGFGGGGAGGQGGGVTGGAGAASAGGFLGLLQSAQQIRNQRANVAALSGSVEQLQASYEAGRIDRFQVDLARQALYNAQSQLLTAEATYQAVTDNFKLDLGLPPELEITLDDPLLNRFQLLDADLEALQERVAATLGQLRSYRAQLNGAPPDGANPNAPPDNGETTLPKLDMDALLKECAAIEEEVEKRLAAVEADFKRLEAALPARRAQLQRLTKREEAETAELDRGLLDVQGLDARVAQRRRELEALRQQIGKIWSALEQFDSDNSRDERGLAAALIETVADLSSRLLELSLLQAGARLESITFAPIDLTPEEALLIAAVNRPDWQNARAQLVDAWRLIYFNANDLLSDLDIVFSGDIGNVGDNPLRLRNTRGRLRVGLQFDAPLTRLAERNVYRQSLIEYQQARRSYYRFRDRVHQGLRNTLRQAQLNEINFELRRAAVLVAISQVDLTQLRLSEPPQIGAEQQFGNTTARDLVQSLADLLNVQNDFLSVWVNHEVQRLHLDHDLGVMQLDPDGLRIEQPLSYAEYYQAALAACAAQRYPSDVLPGIDVSAPADALPDELIVPPAPSLFAPGVDDATLLPLPTTGDSPLDSPLDSPRESLKSMDSAENLANPGEQGASGTRDAQAP